MFDYDQAEDQQQEEPQADVCPLCGATGGEYTPMLDCCAFCP